MKDEEFNLDDDDLPPELNTFCLNDTFDNQGPSSNDPLLHDVNSISVIGVEVHDHLDFEEALEA